MKISDLFNDLGNGNLADARSATLHKLFQEIGRRLFQAMNKSKTTTEG